MSAPANPVRCQACGFNALLPEAYVVRMAGNCCRCAQSNGPSRCGDCGDSGDCARCASFHRDFVLRRVSGEPCRYERKLQPEDFQAASVPCDAEKLVLTVCRHEDQQRTSACLQLLFTAESGKRPTAWHRGRVENCCNPGCLRRVAHGGTCCFPQWISISSVPVPDFVAPQPHWLDGDPDDLNDAPFWPTLEVPLGEDSEQVPVRLANGELQLRIKDIHAGGFGVPWGHTRIYSNRLSNSYDFGNGYNWLVHEWPQLNLHKSDPATLQTFHPQSSGEGWQPSGCTLVLLRGTRNAIWFDEFVSGGSGKKEWRGRFGAKHLLEHDSDRRRFRLKAPNGHRWEFHDFSCDRPACTCPAGALAKHISPSGTETLAAYKDHRLDQVSRAGLGADGSPVLETFNYLYYRDGDNEGRLRFVLHQRKKQRARAVQEDCRKCRSLAPHSPSAPDPREQEPGIARVEYVYYGKDDEHGNLGDLKLAVTQRHQAGRWRNLHVHYYRYYLEAKDTYCQGLLKFAVGPEAVRRIVKAQAGIDELARIANLSLTELAQGYLDGADLKPIADLYLEYHDDRRVSVLATNAGSLRHLFRYEKNDASPSRPHSHWWQKCEEFRPDGSVVEVRTNLVGRPLLTHLSADNRSWIEYREYDATSGLLTKWHHPSSVDHGRRDLEDQQKAKPWTFGAFGLVNLYSYKQDYLVAISQRAAGVEHVLFKYEYTTHDFAGFAIRALERETAAEAGNASGPRDDVTEFAYQWSGHGHLRRRKTTRAAVLAGQNGCGLPAVTEEEYDDYGHLRRLQGPRNLRTETTCRMETGAPVARTLTYSTGFGPEISRETFGSDDFGRITEVVLGEVNAVVNGDVRAGEKTSVVRPASWTRYNDLEGYALSAQGHVRSGSAVVADPVVTTFFDRAGRPVDRITAKRPESLDFSSWRAAFPRSNWLRWEHQEYSDNGLETRRRVYHQIPSSGMGAAGVNYGEETTRQDPAGRCMLAASPGNTLTKQDFDPRGLLLVTSVGTNGANLAPVEIRVYDEPGVYAQRPQGTPGGNGLLSRTTRVASPHRTTVLHYDQRDRVIQATPVVDSDGSAPEMVAQRFAYTNHGQIGATTLWRKRSTWEILDQTRLSIDRQGRVFSTTRVAKGTDGTVSTTVGNAWHNEAGDVFASRPDLAGPFLKTVFDGFGRATGTFLAASGTPALLLPLNDTILEQTRTVFNTAGWVVSETRASRGPAAQGRGNLESLSGSWSVKTHYLRDPLGRARFVKRGAKRLETVAKTVYDAAGEPTLLAEVVGRKTPPDQPVGDPVYRYEERRFDDAGRLARQVFNRVPGGAATSDQNVPIDYDYTPDGHLCLIRAANSQTGAQETRILYGVDAASGSQIATSHLPREVQFASSAAGSGDTRRVLLAYNRQGEIVRREDPAHTVHVYQHDCLGRLVRDEAIPGPATPIPGVDAPWRLDGKVRAIGYEYDGHGRPLRIRSYSKSGALLNLVERAYSPQGQVTLDNQVHNPASTTQGPASANAIRYDYSPTGRLDKITYPSGFAIKAEYAAGADAVMRRPTCLTSPQPKRTPLIGYKYYGARQIYGISLDRANLPAIKGFELQYYLSGLDPQDLYGTLDNLGRVESQFWVRGNPRMPGLGGRVYDSVAYRYAAHGVRRARRPIDAEAHSESYQYDQLDRLTRVTRGECNAAPPGEVVPGSETFEQQWELDATGNARRFVEKQRLPDGAWESVQDQARRHNRLNQVAAIAHHACSPWVTPQYDRSGNAVVVPRPGDPSRAYYCTYDAWNRLVGVTRREGANRFVPVAEYAYDGLHRRIAKRTFDASGKPAEHRRFYYSADWQIVEEWLAAPAGPERVRLSLDRQYVWGLRGPNDLVMRRRPRGGGYEELYAIQDANANVTSLVGKRSEAGVDYCDVLERFHYDPYGRPHFLDKDSQDRTSARSDYDWDVLYGGYQFDPETGLYHVRHRMYHPTLGVWLQPDPQGYADGPNLYQYVRACPITLNDPSGEISLALAIGGLLALWGGLMASHHGAREMGAGVDADDAARYASGQRWFLGGVTAFGIGAGLVAAPLAPASAGFLATTAYAAGEGALTGAFTAGAAAYGLGAEGRDVARSALLGGAVGGVVGASFGAAGWSFARALTRDRGLASEEYRRFVEELSPLPPSVAAARLRDIARNEHGLSFDIRVIDPEKWIYRHRVGYMQVIEGKEVIFLKNREFYRMIEVMRHEIVHVFQHINSPRLFRWATSDLAPLSSVGRFCIELPAHRVASASSIPWRGALRGVVARPLAWGSDVLWLGTLSAAAYWLWRKARQ